MSISKTDRNRILHDLFQVVETSPDTTTEIEARLGRSYPKDRRQGFTPGVLPKQFFGAIKHFEGAGWQRTRSKRRTIDYTYRKKKHQTQRSPHCA